jgi:lysophospholipid acyltransferase (LPLAT)-like uncharacterized protein
MKLLGAGVMYAWWHGQMAAAPAFSTRRLIAFHIVAIDENVCES